MNHSQFLVDHVRLATEKPFEEVARAVERQLGRFDPDVYQALAASGDAEAARARIEAMIQKRITMVGSAHPFFSK